MNKKNKTNITDEWGWKNKKDNLKRIIAICVLYVISFILGTLAIVFILKNKFYSYYSKYIFDNITILFICCFYSTLTFCILLLEIIFAIICFKNKYKTSGILFCILSFTRILTIVFLWLFTNIFIFFYVVLVILSLTSIIVFLKNLNLKNKKQTIKKTKNEKALIKQINDEIYNRLNNPNSNIRIINKEEIKQLSDQEISDLAYDWYFMAANKMWKNENAIVKSYKNFKFIKLKNWKDKTPSGKKVWKFNNHHLIEIDFTGALINSKDPEIKELKNTLAIRIDWEQHAFLHYLIVLSQRTFPNGGMRRQINTEEWDEVVRKQCKKYSIPYIDNWQSYINNVYNYVIKIYKNGKNQKNNPVKKDSNLENQTTKM